MKAKPVKLIYGEGYEPCEIEEATHVKINIPGPSGELYLPVIIKGSRKGTNCWSWNGDVEYPTLKPSVLTNGYDSKDEQKFRCHSWINDGKAIFLSDCSHDMANKTVELLEVDDNDG